MPGQSNKKYQIEYWVSSNLYGLSAEPFNFTHREAEVTLLLPSQPSQEQEADGFCARTTVRHFTVIEAENMAHDILRKVLNLVAYERKARARIERLVRSQVEGIGSIRQCVVYWLEKPGVAVLWDQPANEVQRLLNTELPQQTERALNWLRWAYSAQTMPEAFVFLRMALECLAEEQDIPSLCQTCHQPVSCPKHGPHKHHGVSRKTIEEILDRYGVALSKKESHLRDRLIHGSMDYDLQDRIAMSEVYHRLRPAVVKELGSHLQRAESPWLPSPDVYSHHAFFNCQYKTAYPSEPFPQDCVTSDDIKEYLTLLPRGHQHPKDIKQLVEWPPNW